LCDGSRARKPGMTLGAVARLRLYARAARLLHFGRDRWRAARAQLFGTAVPNVALKL